MFNCSGSQTPLCESQVVHDANESFYGLREAGDSVNERRMVCEKLTDILITNLWELLL